MKLWSWTACEIVDALCTQQVSQLEVLESLESRYFEVNPTINALPTVFFDRAKQQLIAKSKMQSWRRPLMGLPIPIKDSYSVAGVRTTFGSLVFENFIPKKSDLVVQTLEKSGGLIYAKSNTPEFEAGASTFNEVFGITRNPWDVSRSTAGSSGGAAAAVATGMAFIAQGSDFACSIRYPAAFCGIVGLRPTPGLIPQGPNRLPYQNLSVIGPLARNVEDIGLAMDAMVGFDVKDPLTSPENSLGYRVAAMSPLKPQKLGFSMSMNGLAIIAKEVRNSIAKTISLVESLGVEIEYSCPDMTDSEAAFRSLRAAQFAGMWSHILNTHKDLLKPEVVWNIEQGLNLSSSDLAKAGHQRDRIRNELLEYLIEYDFLLMPAAPIEANFAEERFVKEIDGVKMNDYLDWLLLGYVISLTGCPAISVPCALSSSGLPIGVQIICLPHKERELLSLAAWLENVVGKRIRIPITPSDC